MDEEICNNVDEKCYIFQNESMNSIVDFSNDICKECYMPTSCPQGSNAQYQWIFNIPDNYAAQLELNNYLF